MRYRVFATDYDETLAEKGRVAPTTLAALDRLRASGRRVVLVTGRITSDLRAAFPQLDRFDRVVAENGGTLLQPDDGEETALAPPPPEAFLRALTARGVPFDRGRAIVATREPHQAAVLEVIRELGLDLTLSFNKGAVMILPSGVTKATGLAAALVDLSATAREVVAVGDGENDQALLTAVGLGVAVANAVPMVRAAADLVTAGTRGAGVRELVARLLDDDLASVTPGRRARAVLERRYLI